MKGITDRWGGAFSELPESPVMSLRAGNAADNGEPAPPFDQDLDRITPAYLESHFWGLSHLDSQSWVFYLPHFLSYSIENIASPASNAIEAFLFSLRPPDRVPPRFRALSPVQEQAVVAVLDQLAFAEQSAWEEPAMIALEEYWAPGASYRKPLGT